MKESLLISLKVIFAVVIVYIMYDILGKNITIIVAVTVFILYVAYVLAFKTNYDLVLENVGDAKKYLDTIKKRYKSDENLLSLHSAYGLFYLGNTTEAFSELNKVIFEDLKKTKHVFIYYSMKLKEDYENENIEQYRLHLEEMFESGVLTILNINKDIFEAPLLLLNEDYQVLWDNLMELIPVVNKRYFILELEYYLAICHLKLNRLDDAYAVLEFVSNKKIEFIYVQKCKELIKEIK
jgi:hypothetical protein